MKNKILAVALLSTALCCAQNAPTTKQAPSDSIKGLAPNQHPFVNHMKAPDALSKGIAAQQKLRDQNMLRELYLHDQLPCLEDSIGIDDQQRCTNVV